MTNVWITAMFGAIDAREWERLPSFFHPEVVYERPGYPRVEGLEAMLRFYREQRVIASSEHRIEDTAVQGNRGVAWGVAHCVLNDGTAREVGFADVYAFRAGKVAHRRSHFFVSVV